MDSINSLAKAIRASCIARIWDQGVKLARNQAVVCTQSDAEEIVLRVQTPGRGPARVVVLYPEDREWECDCLGREETCSHICAAVIVLCRAQELGDEVLAPSKAAGYLEYRFRPADGGLSLDRYVVSPDGSKVLLSSPLRSPPQEGLTSAVSVSPTQNDLQIDLFLGTRMRGRIPRERLEKLFVLLSAAEHVYWGDLQVEVSEEKIGSESIVEDFLDGIRMTIRRNALVSEVIAASVVRVGNVLHLADAIDWTGARLEKLPIVQEFPKHRLGEFVTKVLPPVLDRFVVQIKTKRLPQIASQEKPRIRLDLEQNKEVLNVYPRIVYGEPEIARVEGQRLRCTGDQVPIRDLGSETRLANELKTALHIAIGIPVSFAGQEAIDFVKRLQHWNGDLAAGILGPLVRENQLRPRLQIEDGICEIFFDCTTDDGEPTGSANADQVIRAWEAGEALVPLETGGFAPIPHGWLEKYGAIVADLLAVRTPAQALPAHAGPIVAELCDALKQPRPATLDKLTPLIGGYEGLPAVSLPADLIATLRPYQEYGVRWLQFLADAGLGAILADDMGLGKTLQALCVVRGRTLVVCPRSVLFNWQAEIERFRPGLVVSVYHGPKRCLRDVDITLTTYALLRQDIALLTQQKWKVIILDEAHAIKNASSQTAQAAYQLKAAFRIAMSGTPVENRLEELWSLLQFANPGFLGGLRRFQERYVTPIRNGHTDVAQRLQKRIHAVVLRRKKSQVVPELPPRTDSILHCELTEEERKVYDAVRAATRKQCVSLLNDGSKVFAVLEALLRLRQAACHSALVPGNHARTSSKVTALVEALEQAVAGGHKALVFSQWTSFLDLMEPHFHEASLSYLRIDGQTRDRGEIVASFQSQGGPPILLVSLKAASTGLNLTAADHVFLCDPWWNPATEDQAADRTHRIGQTKPVIVYKLVAKETVEEQILILQAKKRRIADAALAGTISEHRLSREDLLQLLD